MSPLFDASILLLITVELVPLLCINYISVKLFECYDVPLFRCIGTCWCYLKGDINCYYYYQKTKVVRANWNPKKGMFEQDK